MDDTAQEDVCIGIYDQADKLLDVFTDLDLESSLGDAYERLMRIYQMARRQALGVDHAIEAIISHLNNSLDFEPRRHFPKKSDSGPRQL